VSSDGHLHAPATIPMQNYRDFRSLTLKLLHKRENIHVILSLPQKTDAKPKSQLERNVEICL
jgi:hypothetical protein